MFEYGKRILREVSLEGEQGCLAKRLWQILETKDRCVQVFLMQKVIPFLPNLMIIVDGVVVDGSVFQTQKEYDDDVIQFVMDQSYRMGILTKQMNVSSLNDYQIKILECVANSRSDGVTQADLSSILKIDPKSVFFHLKKLLDLRLVVRYPVISKKAYTNIILFYLYDDVMGTEAFGESNDGGGSVFRKDVYFRRISDTLESARDKIVVSSDLFRSLGETHKRYKSAIANLAYHGYVERVLVRDMGDGKLLSAVRLLKPWDGSGSGDQPAIRVEDPEDDTSVLSQRILFLDVPLEQQIIHILAEHPDGLTLNEINAFLQLSNKLIYKLVIKLADKKLIKKVAELNGKMRQFRFFAPASVLKQGLPITYSNLTTPQTTPNVMSPAAATTDPEIGISSGSSSSSRSVTPNSGNGPIVVQTESPITDANFALISKSTSEGRNTGVTEIRRIYIYNRIKESKAIIVNKDFTDELQGKLDQDTTLARKTIIRDMEYLASQKMIKLTTKSYKRLNGMENNVHIAHLIDVPDNDPIIQDLVEKARNNELVKIKPCNQLNYKVIDGVNVDRLVTAHDNDADGMQGKKTEHLYWFSRALENGYIAAKMVRVKIIHQILYLFCKGIGLSTSENCNDKNNETKQLLNDEEYVVFSVPDFFMNISLRKYCQVFGVADVSLDVKSFCQSEENFDIMLKDLPVHIRNVIFSTTRYKTVLWRIFNILHDLGVVSWHSEDAAELEYLNNYHDNNMLKYLQDSRKYPNYLRLNLNVPLISFSDYRNPDSYMKTSSITDVMTFWTETEIRFRQYGKSVSSKSSGNRNSLPARAYDDYDDDDDDDDDDEDDNEGKDDDDEESNDEFNDESCVHVRKRKRANGKRKREIPNVPETLKFVSDSKAWIVKKLLTREQKAFILEKASTVTFNFGTRIEKAEAIKKIAESIGSDIETVSHFIQYGSSSGPGSGAVQVNSISRSNIIDLIKRNRSKKKRKNSNNDDKVDDDEEEEEQEEEVQPSKWTRDEEKTLLKCFAIGHFIFKTIFNSRLPISVGWTRQFIRKPEAMIRKRLKSMLKDYHHRETLENISMEWKTLYENLVDGNIWNPDDFSKVETEDDLNGILIRFYEEYEKVPAKELLKLRFNLDFTQHYDLPDSLEELLLNYEVIAIPSNTDHHHHQNDDPDYNNIQQENVMQSLGNMRKKYEMFQSQSFLTSTTTTKSKAYEEEEYQIGLTVCLLKMILLCEDEFYDANKIYCVLSEIPDDIMKGAMERTKGILIKSRGRSKGRFFFGREMALSDRFHGILNGTLRSDIYDLAYRENAKFKSELGLGSYIVNEEKFQGAGLMPVFLNVLCTGKMRVAEIYNQSHNHNSNGNGNGNGNSNVNGDGGFLSNGKASSNVCSVLVCNENENDSSINSITGSSGSNNNYHLLDDFEAIIKKVEIIIKGELASNENMKMSELQEIVTTTFNNNIQQEVIFAALKRLIDQKQIMTVSFDKFTIYEKAPFLILKNTSSGSTSKSSLLPYLPRMWRKFDSSLDKIILWKSIKCVFHHIDYYAGINHTLLRKRLEFVFTDIELCDIIDLLESKMFIIVHNESWPGKKSKTINQKDQSYDHYYYEPVIENMLKFDPSNVIGEDDICFRIP